jgi:hypothetical protein
MCHALQAQQLSVLLPYLMLGIWQHHYMHIAWASLDAMAQTGMLPTMHACCYCHCYCTSDCMQATSRPEAPGAGCVSRPCLCLVAHLAVAADA